MSNRALQQAGNSTKVATGQLGPDNRIPRQETLVEG